MKIFLSYSWSNTEQADSIEEFFSSIGVSIIRDINDLEYRKNLRSFMSLIRESDFAIVLISHDYLKSPNCIFELIELSKEKEFGTKFLPVLIDGTKIYSIENKLEIIGYWNDKVSSTKDLLEEKEVTKTISLIKELKLYETIYSEIDSLLATISDCKNIEYTSAYSNNFRDIITHLKLEDPDLKTEISRIQKIENIEIQDLELEKLKQKYTGNSSILFSEAFINGKRNNLSKAEHFYKLYLKKEEHYGAYTNLGSIYSQRGEFEKAELNFNKALELYNDSFELFFNMGLLEANKKNYEKAIEHFQKSIEINSQNYNSLYSLGKVYSDFMNDLDQGLTYYQKAIEIDSTKPETYSNIASIYLRKKDYDQVIINLEKGLEINPNDYVAMYNLGAVYANIKGKVNEAKLLYRRSIRENPSYSSPKIALAKLLILSGGDNIEAVELFKDVLKIEPDNEDAQVLLKYFETKNTANRVGGSVPS